MTRYILTAAGPDKPGIIAALTKILFESGCNLEDSAMTRLQGEFAALLIFSTPPGLAEKNLSARLKSLEKTLLLSSHLKPLTPKEAHAPKTAGRTCLVTVYGADKPGIVYRVADILAWRKVNVTDLATHRTGKGPQGGYILYVEGELPRGVETAALQKDFEPLAKDMGVTVSVKSLAAEAL